MIELTPVLLALALVAALVGGLHPMFVSTLPLVLGSMLGNNLHLHRALRGVGLFVVMLMAEWAIIGAAAASILQRNESEPLFYTVAAIAAIVGALEIKSAISAKGLLMQFPEKPWRHVRKHAYRIAKPMAIIKLNLHMLPWILVFTGTTYLSALTLTSRASEETGLTIAALYSVMLIIPFCVLATLTTTAARLSDIHHWVSRFSPPLHLFQALILFTFSVLLTLHANGGNS